MLRVGGDVYFSKHFPPPPMIELDQSNMKSTHTPSLVEGFGPDKTRWILAVGAARGSNARGEKMGEETKNWERSRLTNEKSKKEKISIQNLCSSIPPLETIDPSRLFEHILVLSLYCFTFYPWLHRILNAQTLQVHTR